MSNLVVYIVTIMPSWVSRARHTT